MITFLQLVFAGLALGCTYALVAVGFTIIYKASGVINFAQGELLLAGAYLTYIGVFVWHLDFFVALLVGLAATAAIGVLFERLVLRRMIGRPVFSILMITIGLQILLQTALSLGFGENASGLPAPAPFDVIGREQIGGLTLGISQIATIGVTAVLVVLLFVFFRYTKYGLAMRATALDQEVALAMGVNVRLVYALAWGIAGAVAALGGVLLASQNTVVSPFMDATALLAFPAIILGGVDSIPGAIVGGIIIGLTQQLVGGYGHYVLPIFNQDFAAIAPYLLMIIVLLVRPYGLFGTRKVERI
jgi:branched-chain amino acid transport system permease protein